MSSSRTFSTPGPEWGPDLLGPEFRCRSLPLGTDPDGEGQVNATLIRFEGAPPSPRAVVMHVHGHSDYFFHHDLCRFLADRNMATYGIDLRKCGRSRRDEHTPHYVSDLTYYDLELDAAVDIIATEHPDTPVVISAHSTGGLIAALWLARRRDRGRLAPITGLILNSPWLDLDFKGSTRIAIDYAIRLLAACVPFYQLPLKPVPDYGVSIHVDFDGEFDFDTTLKPFGGVGIRPGWLLAIRQAQAALQEGLHLPIPVLLLRSARSTRPPTARRPNRKPAPAVDTDSDLILNVAAMARYKQSVAEGILDVPIDGARHDVYLSRPEVVTEVFAQLGGWLDSTIPTATIDQPHKSKEH